MIKITFCLRRLPSLSLAEFQDYWLNKHAPLVARHRDALRIQRYVQLHTREIPNNDLIRGSRAPDGNLAKAPDIFDGVAELWWETLDDLNAINEDEAAIAAGIELLEDERKFIDLARSPLWFGEEHEIIG